MALVACGAYGASERTLTLDEYRDKMKAAWVGQMVGVAWGMPTEFKWGGEVIPEDKVPVWKSSLPNRWAYNNDDLYVEMTFLKTLEDYGIDASIRQAGIDFANSKYGLWCANAAGRSNLRRGIAPPDSSHPKYNNRSNDIDYQIEADYSGIIAPGCPQEAIRLGNVFGRLMNYGDGVWAGQFIGAMYAEAFFTDDVNALLDAGLAAIPAESDYAKMVRDVRAWHKENPKDWIKCWERIRGSFSSKYNKKLRDANGGIDVRLNGACIVLGLLYGEGDLDKSMVLSMRCGWDSDCNPSNVGGILFAARGFKALDAKYVEKLDYKREFSYTAYNLPSLFAVCEKLARQVVVRNGGRVEKDASGAERFVIPVKKPVPDQFIPTWNASAPAHSVFTKEEMSKIDEPFILPHPDKIDIKDPTKRVQKSLDLMFPGWKTTPNGTNSKKKPGAGIVQGWGKQIACLLTQPPKDGAVTLWRTIEVPAGKPSLHFAVSHEKKGEFKLVVRVDGDEVLSSVLAYDSKAKKGEFPAMRPIDVSLEKWAGKTVKIELVNESTGNPQCAALWNDVKITSESEK